MTRPSSSLLCNKCWQSVQNKGIVSNLYSFWRKQSQTLTKFFANQLIIPRVTKTIISTETNRFPIIQRQTFFFVFIFWYNYKLFSSFFKQSKVRASTDKCPTQLLYPNALGSWWCFSLLLFCNSSVQSECDRHNPSKNNNIQTNYKKNKKKQHVANSFCKIFQCWAMFPF